MRLLELSEVSVAFGARLVLNRVSLDFQAGELLGLIGPNGAGKTTLLRSACGLLRPQTGSIRLLGRPLSALKPPEIAKILAYLPQGGEAHWSLAVKDLVLLGRLPYRPRWKGFARDDYRIVMDSLEVCDVRHLAERPVDQLSGGERSRVLLARALASKPRLLLADEPVTGLDPLHQLEVMEKFRLLANSGTGVVIIMHDLSLAARYCDRLVLIDDHRIVADQKPAEVLQNKHLRNCFGVQFKIEFGQEVPIVLPLAKWSQGNP